ncbi:ovochymase-2 [Dendropsophus ebraccatus]|uniref:ovochymase-2 n=1 Tax=Dendropsophus ebraccatus TaxID=150705 RepID=UPI003831B638
MAHVGRGEHDSSLRGFQQEQRQLNLSICFKLKMQPLGKILTNIQSYRKIRQGSDAPVLEFYLPDLLSHSEEMDCNNGNVEETFTHQASNFFTFRCGERPAINFTSSNSLFSRIVGGTAAQKEECPWMASLKHNGNHFCGGTIISDTYILTAAHCISAKHPMFKIRVYVGDHDFSVEEASEQSFFLKAVFKHPNFNPGKPFNYDIAILELMGKIQFGKNIQPACLPNPDDVFLAGSLCITLGWGRLQEGGHVPNRLQQVALPLIEYKRCLKIMESVDRHLGFDTVICAGYPEGQKDACQGDSGGPFLCQRSQGRWVLIGLTSWGLGCARKWSDNRLQPRDKRGSPGIFTDIQRLLNWLSANLNQEKPDLPAQKVQCSTDDGSLNGMEGEILLPKGTKKHYSNNEKCIWTISVPKGKHILLIFNNFNLEWDYSCDLDYLMIYSEFGRLIGKFCGDVIPRPLLITDTNVTLKFISDFKEYRTGFSLSYLAVEPHLYPGSDCGSVAVIFEEGQIQTMNHPKDYSSHAHCQWVVHGPKYHVIQVTFLAFEIEQSDKCIFDYLIVYHDLQETVVAGKFCGFEIPDPILSVSNVMQITFTSDHYGNFKGFQAVISFVASSSSVNPDIHWREPLRSKDTVEDFGEDCGVSLHPPRFNQPSIAAAEEAMQGSYPWHVSISFGYKHVCNGAIVSKIFVLTSASCVARSKVFQNVVLVVAGLQDLDSLTTAQEQKVKRVIPHPQYDPSSRDFDVALIQLEMPFEYNSHVKPICLPDEDSKLETDDLCVVTGWYLNMAFPTKLQQQQVPVLQNDVCKKYYKGLTDRMFCAGAKIGEDNTSCLAQSGAPLVYPSHNRTYFIFGIVSWGVGCTDSPKLGVYSAVPLFTQWIRATIQSAEGPADIDTELQHPLIPLEQLLKKVIQPESSPTNNSSSSQDIYVPCKDMMPLQSPGEIKLVVSGQDSPKGDRCQLIFQAPEGHFILLNFKEFNTSHEHFSLVIYEGEPNNKTFKAQVTVEKIPYIVKCTGPAVTVEANSSVQDSKLQLWLSYTFHNQN